MEFLSHFEERAGIVASHHEWGRWYQNVREVNIEINIPPGTTAKDLVITIKPNQLECKMANGTNTFMKGKLFSTVKVDESIWTVEERRVLRIVLAKANFSVKENVWTSLLKNQFQADPEIEKQMRNKVDLERFQMEYPGMDFSGAKLA